MMAATWGFGPGGGEALSTGNMRDVESREEATLQRLLLDTLTSVAVEVATLGEDVHRCGGVAARWQAAFEAQEVALCWLTQQCAVLAGQTEALGWGINRLAVREGAGRAGAPQGAQAAEGGALHAFGPRLDTLQSMLDLSAGILGRDFQGGKRGAAGGACQQRLPSIAVDCRPPAIEPLSRSETPVGTGDASPSVHAVQDRAQSESIRGEAALRARVAELERALEGSVAKVAALEADLLSKDTQLRLSEAHCIDLQAQLRLSESQRIDLLQGRLE